MSKKIINLPSGSINDSSIGFIGDPNTGALTETSYRAMKDYFQNGISSLLTGSYVTTGSFNNFSSSYNNDSSSFYNNDKNIYSSQSGYTTTSSYNPFTASYFVDSGSFDIRIKAISGSIPSGSYITTTTFGVFSASYVIDSSSINQKLVNINASESNYVPTSSYNPFTASYFVDSSSFLNKINNVYSSESNYVPTSSFNILSSSIKNDSSSIDTRINNVYSSESNYLPTGSILGSNNYIPIYSGSKGFTFGLLYYSGSSLLINQVNGLNNALLQVAGPVSVNDTSYLLLPRGTTAQRPTGSFAMIRGNTETTNIEFHNGVGWISLGSGSGIFASGSVTSVGLSLPSSLFSVYNSPIVGAGVLSASLNTQSANLVYASPVGTSGIPIFRTLDITDIAALTSSFIAGYVLTGSFNTFTSSYFIDSASILINIANVFASESNYVPTSSYNPFTASYLNTSASINNSLSNVYASESNYLLTSSFSNFSSSYLNDSSSFLTRIINVFASESNYVPTSSIIGNNNYLPVFTGSSAITQSSIYQSGSFIILGRTGSINNSLLQLFGSIYISGSIYDSSNSTGSAGQMLGFAPGGILWISTGSGGWNLSGNSISSGSFLGSTNAQDLIFKRNNVQVGAFFTNNNIVFGNSNNSTTGSNAIVLGGVNNFANNMAVVIDGANNSAIGNSSVVVGGQSNITPGVGSVTLGGINLSASAAYAVVLGRFNDPIASSNQSSWIGGDPIFIIGNGSSTGSLSNAFVVNKTGSIVLSFYANTSSAVLGVDNNGNIVNMQVVSQSVYNIDSSSFSNRINNIFASESNYLSTASFNIFSSSFLTYSSSTDVKINNVYASESNYLLTSSFNNFISGSSGQIALFNTPHSLTSSLINQLGNSIISISGAIIQPTNFTPSVTNTVAFGFNNILYGSGSFAHGFNNTVNSYIGHAEGSNNAINGVGAHSEGTGNTAYGDYSHAEGSGSISYGFGSHTEGLGTISTGSYQLVIGRFNKINANSLFIIGNGFSSMSRNDVATYYSESIEFNKDLYLNTSSLHVGQYLYDSFGNTGSNGQVISSIIGGIKWSDLSGSSTGSNGFVTNGIFQAYTSSTNIQIANIFASESKYTLTSSFNLLTQSFNTFTSSYIIDSGSFDTRIKTISGSLSTLTGSYVITGTFNSFTASYIVDSSSFNTIINNVFASESNYLPSSSLRGLSNYLAVFSGSNILTTSSIYQSGSSILIGRNTGSNNAVLQVFGDIYISKSIYDSIGSTGSLNQTLIKTQSGFQWVNTGSAGNFTKVINFVIGDGQSFTPSSGSTIFSSSLLVSSSILQFSQEGFIMAPISRSLASWFSFTSSQGRIDINNTTFSQDSYFQILYI